MKILQETETAAISQVLKSGRLIVARTDTIYGILADANNKISVETLYKLRNRPAKKASIVLISSFKQLWSQESHQAFKAAPTFHDPTSIIVPAGKQTPSWITRGGDTIAVRQPKLNWLQKVLEQTGPCVAPSANLADQLPARSIFEAFRIFGESVTYINGGEVPDNATPSAIVQVTENNELIRIR